MMRSIKWRCKRIFNILFLFIWLFVTPGIQSDSPYKPGEILDVKPHVQHTSVWCWLAITGMISEYITGRRLEDCEVIEAYDRFYHRPGGCCPVARRCLRTGEPGEVEKVLANVFNIHGLSLNRPLSFNEIAASIDAQRPLIAWLWNSATTAHGVVVVGYQSPETVIILDPMLGKLQRVAYRTLLHDNGRDWLQTILIFTARQGGGDSTEALAVPEAFFHYLDDAQRPGERKSASSGSRPADEGANEAVDSKRHFPLPESYF